MRSIVEAERATILGMALADFPPDQCPINDMRQVVERLATY